MLIRGLFPLLLEDVQIGDRDRNLRLDLEQLILHVENHLLDHLLRVLGLIDEVIEIGPDQGGNTFQ